MQIPRHATPPGGNSLCEEGDMQNVVRKAEQILKSSASLYRELAVSALRLVPGRS